MINPSLNTTLGPTSFYLNTEALTEEQKDTHELVLRRSLHQLFRSVAGNESTNILLWGQSGCGKTSFCATIMNTIHIHSANLRPEDDRLNFSVTTNAAPNPIIQYPSDLVNLLDVNSGIVRDLIALKKIVQFLDGYGTEINAVCLFLDMDNAGNPCFVKEAFRLYFSIKLIKRIAILILNKVDLFQSELTPLERSAKLDETLVKLRERGFDRIVPMTNYREGIDERPNLFTKHSSVEVLYHARFGKSLPLTSPPVDENPPVFGN